MVARPLLALFLCSCHMAFSAPDAGPPPRDAGVIANDAGAMPDGGAVLDSGSMPADAGASRWAIDQGPRDIGAASEYLFDAELAADGDRVALTIGRTNADDHRGTRLEAYVESPWAIAWPGDMWTTPRKLADVELG